MLGDLVSLYLAVLRGVDPTSVAALDHIVVATENPERAVTLYGGRLGLDLRLDR